jgi:hypothetical protein
LNRLRSEKENLESLEIYFIIQYEKDGTLLTDELIPDGNNIKLTSENLEDYILKMYFIVLYRIEYYQLKDRVFINEIKKGLFSVNSSLM